MGQDPWFVGAAADGRHDPATLLADVAAATGFPLIDYEGGYAVDGGTWFAESSRRARPHDGITHLIAVWAATPELAQAGARVIYDAMTAQPDPWRLVLDHEWFGNPGSPYETGRPA